MIFRRFSLILILTAMFALCALSSTAQTNPESVFQTSSAGAAAPNRNPTANPQPRATPEPLVVTTQDLQAFRQIAAERAGLIKENAQLRSDYEKAEQSAGKWQKQAEAEKYRADVVQENRITKLNSALTEKDEALLKSNAANRQLHEQHKTDVQEIANLRFDVSKLKGDRWRWGAVGFITGGAAGAVGGFYIGHKSKDTNILFGSKGGLADYRLASFQF